MRRKQLITPEHLDSQRNRIERLAAIGASEEDIAAELQIPLHRLQKRFRRELTHGVVRGKHRVLQTLLDNARSGVNMAATAIQVQAQCDWRYIGSASNATPVIHSVLKIVTTNPCAQD